MREYLEKSDRHFAVEFAYIPVPSTILIHLIEIVERASHLRTTTFQKIPVGQDGVHFLSSIDFHIMFIEFQSEYYLSFVDENDQHLTSTTKTTVTSAQGCQSIAELLNMGTN